jgi:hypothetical protein
MTTRAPAEHRSVANPITFDQQSESALQQAMRSTRLVSRRNVVRTATKLVYAAPLVVATLKLGVEDASAQVISPVRP